MKILQITAHLGSGAGKAITGLSILIKQKKPEWINEIILLERPEKCQYVSEAEKQGIMVTISPTMDFIYQKCKNSDVIIVNWWANPFMFPMLNTLSGISGRIILWSHFNGCVYPNISANFLRRFIYTFFTCQYSLENPEWTDAERKEISRNSSIVYGMGVFEPAKVPHKFNYNWSKQIIIGYVGTLDYSKINTQFVSACIEIVKRLNNVKFVLYGDCCDKLREDILSSSYSEYFVLKGYSDVVRDVLPEFDLFGYPLNPMTSGTTENSILEAMAAALPIVVLNQGTEKYIIQNEKTGLLADNMQDYVRCICLLATRMDLRQKYGQAARRQVCKCYDSNLNAENFCNELEKIVQRPKQVFDVGDLIGETPIDYLLSISGKYKNLILEILFSNNSEKLEEIPTLMKGKSKSSIIHFAKIYKQDSVLQDIAEKIIK